MVKEDYDIIVIGAGSGGLTTAIGGKGIGAKVLLVEKEKIGGDCTHHGCVPSKTLIKAGKIARNIKDHSKYGLEGDVNFHNFDMKKVLEKVQKTVDSIYEHETPEVMESMGIDVEIGEGKFLDEKTIEINDKKITSRYFVIATGSRAIAPEIPGLDKINFMTNKTIFDPKSYESLAIIGAGPIGCEIGQAINNLGVRVHLLNNRRYIMPREDSESAQKVQKQFIEDGINLHLNTKIIEVRAKGSKKIINFEYLDSNKVESIEVDEILVSAGRTPNVEGLNLEAANVGYDGMGIKVSEKGQTKNKRIYAVGDIIGGMQFTHLANSHGKSALASIIFKLNAKYETEVVPRVTFTTPEVASVGINEDDLHREGLPYHILRKNYTGVDRAITDSDTRGFYKIIVDKKGFVKGATIVGEGAGELIGEIALMMKNKIHINNLANTIHPYPTYGYGLRNTADGFRGMSYTETKKKWVKKIFSLRG